MNDLPENWVRLTPAKKRNRKLYVRKSAVISVEEDTGSPNTTVRLKDSSYPHIVVEAADEVMRMVMSDGRDETS